MKNRADFYTPELARALQLAPTSYYDRCFEALVQGGPATQQELVRLAKQELQDRVTAMKALKGRTTEQFLHERNEPWARWLIQLGRESARER